MLLVLSPSMVQVTTARPTLAEVYRDTFQHVWNTLRRLGVPERDLEDAAHEVYLVVQRRLGDYDPERPLRAWLTGICYRVASDDRRRAFRRREVLWDAGEVPASEPTAEAALEAAQAQRRVAAALETLPLEQRVVFVMHDIDGFSMPDIARELGAPLNTLYSRLRLGRARFEAAIRGDGHGPG